MKFLSHCFKVAVHAWCTLVMPKGSPAFAADSAVRLAMATTSTPGMACNLGMWCSFVLPPAPIQNAIENNKPSKHEQHNCQISGLFYLI